MKKILIPEICHAATSATGRRHYRVLFLSLVLAGIAVAGNPASARAAETDRESLAGDASRGKELFAGTSRLQMGGPPCAACHQAGEIAAFGGTLGPDLTAAHEHFGAAGLQAMLASLPFPTMQPLYESRQLSAQEQADLGAFLQRTTGEYRNRSIEHKSLSSGRMGVWAASCALFFLLLVHFFFGRGRNRGVRKLLVGRSSGDGA